MTDVPLATEVCAAERAAERQALFAELRELEQHDDQTSLERRYELHCALTWLVFAPDTAHAQEHAEQALALARRLADPQREVRALHLLGHVYLASHTDLTEEQCRTGQGFHEAALQIREALLGPDHPDVAESLKEILGQGRFCFWPPVQPYVEMAKRAVAICERAFGPEHERTCMKRCSGCSAVWTSRYPRRERMLPCGRSTSTRTTPARRYSGPPTRGLLSCSFGCACCRMRNLPLQLAAPGAGTPTSCWTTRQVA